MIKRWVHAGFSEKFAEKLIMVGECWIYKNESHLGYGTYREGGKRYYAHRYAWIKSKGKIPKGIFVCHKCDTPSCVNPDHLFLGTQLENIHDMIRKGRKAPYKKIYPTVEEVLTPSQIKEIEDIYTPVKTTRKNDFSLKGLSEKYGVSKSIIEKVVARKKSKEVGA